MVFSSLTFIFFLLPSVLILYLAVPRILQLIAPGVFRPAVTTYRNFILLFFSLIFYAWGEPIYVVLMLFSIGMNYTCGVFLSRTNEPTRRNWILVIGITLNLSLLFFFKYFSLGLETAEWFIRFFTSQPDFKFNVPQRLYNIPLPLGISFFTFQAMSYVIDVYRRKVAFEPSLINFATYITMFPQLVAGPIVRYASIAEELHRFRFSYDRFADGVRIFIIGLSSKVIFANAFAQPADAIFALEPAYLSPMTAWLGAIAYGLQIYFDFAGYSIMAIGMGHMLGFNIMRNFDIPYISQSITEFWRRWHISLSTWFRDYLYIPLGGNRYGNWVTYRNLMIVFALCGLWHGAQWSFVVWGLYHGIFLVFERACRDLDIKIQVPKPARHIYVLIVVLIGWVFFRSDSLTRALTYLGVMFGFREGLDYYAWQAYFSPFMLTLMAIGSVMSVVNQDFVDWLKVKLMLHPRLQQALGGITYAVLFEACVFLLIVGTHNPFIYYRF